MNLASYMLETQNFKTLNACLLQVY